jgi:hypothetical protein
MCVNIDEFIHTHTHTYIYMINRLDRFYRITTIRYNYVRVVCLM